MNTAHFFLLLPLILTGCQASLSQEMRDQKRLNWKLMAAALSGSQELMIDLLKQGADVNFRYKRGETVLHFAARIGHLTCAKALIGAKADVNVRDNYDRTALHEGARWGHLTCVKALIEAKADVNVRNTDGKTALHEAVEENHLDCVKALIEAKADINSCNDKGKTALHKAVRKGRLAACLKALIEAKADVNVRDNKGETTLHKAAKDGRLAYVKALIEAKADVNARNTDGETALHRAANRGCLDCLKALIEVKAEVYARDNRGKAALHGAFENGKLDCVKTLVKYSYTLLPSKEVVSASRKRIFQALGVFVGLRNQHIQVAGLQDTTLQYEILSWDSSLQEDLVVILLDELTKGKEIKNVALIRSKEAAVSYLAKKVKEMVPTILERVENLDDLIKEGLDERINRLKSKVNV